jgi:hypothetical protein
MRRAALALPLVLALISVAEAAPVRKCDAEAKRLFGERPVVVDQKLAAPRRVHNVPIDFSGMGDHRTGSGNWMAEALIAADGTIAQVWTIRSPRFEPAWPEFEERAVGNVKQWRYEPTVVDGAPRWVCMVVVMTIHWR